MRSTMWMARNYPGIPFERYADDAICHCRTEAEAEALRARSSWSGSRHAGWRSTRRRRKSSTARTPTAASDYPGHQFDFLGYYVPAEVSEVAMGAIRGLVHPGGSPKALKAIRQAVRRWGLQTRSDKALDDLARMFNPYIRGWINYYSHFYKSAMYPTSASDRLPSGSDGHAASSSASGKSRKVRASWLARVVRIIAGSVCSLAASVWPKAEHWEPYELRGSRTVLGARGGEIPPRDSTALDLLPPSHRTGRLRPPTEIQLRHFPSTGRHARVCQLLTMRIHYWCLAINST